MSELLSMISIRDRLKQLFMAPTVDKGFSIFSTMLLGTMFVTLVAPGIEIEERILLLVIQCALCVGSTISALLFKKYDQPARDATSARLKAEIDHDYLLKNPKLKETEIYMNELERYNDRLDVLVQLVEAALNVKIRENGEKYNDPIKGPTADASVPWSLTGTGTLSGDLVSKEVNKDNVEGQ